MEDTGKLKKWYALFVMTGKEDDVKERLIYRLKGLDIRIVVPKRRLRERRNGIWEYRVKTLFPGYILLFGEIGVKEYYLLKRIPGLLRILKNGYELLEINEDEVSVISRLICNSEIIDISGIYKNNGRILVVDGPLLGLDGIIEAVDKRKGRVKVRLKFMGEPRLVDLGASIIQPF